MIFFGSRLRRRFRRGKVFREQEKTVIVRSSLFLVKLSNVLLKVKVPAEAFPTGATLKRLLVVVRVLLIKK